MKTWPKIKLVDDRGRTVTVFRRMPTFETVESDSEGLTLHQVLDFKAGCRPPIESEENTALLVNDLAQFIADFIATCGRLPGTSPEHVEDDALALTDAINRATEARGLELVDRKEVMELARAAAHETNWFVDLLEFRKHVEAQARAGHPVSLFPTDTQFVGAPQGDSRWEATPKPAGRKAASHIEAEMVRDGFQFPRPNESRTPVFDGKELPAWADVQKVLDSIAEHGEAGDILTLTVDQLRCLVAQR